MKTTILIAILTFVPGFQVISQSMIGLGKELVREHVKQECREFHRDNSVVRQRFNYLKYVNSMKTKTWILYFDEENVCKSTKMICDYSEMDAERARLDEKFGKADGDVWTFEQDGEQYQISLTKQDWYFSLRERRLMKEN
ncbi:MAG: hypothetical protein CSA96_06350 [Bacteroidetes bacterium]|nr:MAG: hypothetical protein CSA96_06350 [Bacteroidota bacterium]